MPLVHYNQYNQADFSTAPSAPIPQGKHRVRIINVREMYSQKSKTLMLALTLEVSGFKYSVRGFILLDNSSQEAVKKTNQTLGTVFDGFNINHGDMDTDHWIGHIGGVKINHREANDGNIYPNVQYFLLRKEVDKLPAWGIPNNINNTQQVAPTTTTTNQQQTHEGNDIPF